MVYFIFIKILMENYVSKHWRPSSVASGPGLHCLPMSHKKEAMFIWVKTINLIAGKVVLTIEKFESRLKPLCRV